MAGGLTKGKSHSKGGIKMKVGDTGQEIEVEGGEGIINKHTMSSKDKFDYEGKDMTACEIASDLNQKTGNGVSFDCEETDNTDMTPTDPSTGFSKGGKTDGSIKWKKNIGDEGWSSNMENEAAYENQGGYISEDGDYTIFQDVKFKNVDGDERAYRSGYWTTDYKDKSLTRKMVYGNEYEDEPFWFPTLKDAKNFVNDYSTKQFAKGGKPKRKYKKTKMAKSKKNTGAYAKLVSAIMKRDSITYKQAQVKAKDEYVSGATGKKSPKKSYKGRLDKLKSKSAPKAVKPKKSLGICDHCEEPLTDIKSSYCSAGCEDAENKLLSQEYAKGGNVSLTPEVKKHIDSLSKAELSKQRIELLTEVIRDDSQKNINKYRDELNYLQYRIGEPDFSDLYSKGGDVSAPEFELVAKLDSFTGKPMWAGYQMHSGETIAEDNTKELIKQIKLSADDPELDEMSDEDILEYSYDEEIHFYTEWFEEEDSEYVKYKGKIYVLDGIDKELSANEFNTLKKEYPNVIENFYAKGGSTKFKQPSQRGMLAAIDKSTKAELQKMDKAWTKGVADGSMAGEEYKIQLKRIKSNLSKFAKGGDVSGKPEVESIDKIVSHYNGEDFDLDNYPPKSGSEWMPNAMELTLEEAKQFAKEIDIELDYEDEYIDEAENLQDLQSAIEDNSDEHTGHDNTYNSSWWGGVVDFFVFHRKEDMEGYGEALVILRMHKGGDPRGNYYGYEAFKLNSFIEDFPAYYAKLTYQIKTNQGTITLDTEDMEGYTLLVVEDETGTFEVDDYVNLDEVEEQLNMKEHNIYAKGGKTNDMRNKKYNQGGDIMPDATDLRFAKGGKASRNKLPHSIFAENTELPMNEPILIAKVAGKGDAIIIRSALQKAVVSAPIVYNFGDKKRKSFSKGGISNISSLTFNTAKELKQAIRTGFNYTPKFDASDIVSINGYNIKSIMPDITNTSVSIYDVSLQGIKHFFSPYIVKIKAGKERYSKGGWVDSNSPKIYVASLSDYNAGRLEGEWLDFDDYNDESEIMDAIQDMLDGLNEKYKDGENREEYAIHDHENTYGIIGEYSNEADFEKVYALKEAVEESGLPFDIIAARISDTRGEVDEVQDDYYGSFDSEEDFADQFKDDAGVSNASYYIYCDETTARVVAGEQADSDVYGGMDDEDILERVDMLDEYESADDDDKEDVLDAAKEKLYEEIYDEWNRGLRDDAVDFLVNEQGIYSEEDIVDLSWLSFDMEKWTRDLMYDFNSYYSEEDKMYYIFNN